MSAPLFDTYVIVDWSARSKPSPIRPSKDAIWWTAAWREPDLHVAEPIYERTRAAAERSLTKLLAMELSASRRVLVGFDFPFGYPEGVAQTVAGQPRALALWAWLTEHVEDGEQNANNRYAVAARINRLYDGVGPFWGRPAGWDYPDIPTTAHTRHGNHPAERRRADRAAKGAMTVWQLAYAGSVGSQVLMGLPTLQRLRHAPELAADTAIWPFEAGLAAPTTRITIAEIYPSLIANQVQAQRAPDEILDRAQVRVNATAFARLDAAGALAPLFRGPETLGGPDRDAIEREEAWILGTGFEDRLSEAA